MPAAPSALQVAHIPGDGIGIEVTEAALPVIELAAGQVGTAITWSRLDWGCAFYQHTGAMMPADALAQLRGYDAVFFGAMGGEGVPDDVAAWTLRLAICQGLDQYVSHRPAWSIEGLDGPLGPKAFDLVVVRENTEGEFVDVGGRTRRSSAFETAVECSVFTRSGVRRVAQYAFELARSRRGKLTIATKSNVLRHGMSLWDSVSHEVGEGFSDVEQERLYVDALAAELVLHPDRFDVILASNAHGDIISDLTGALMGSLGMAGSADLDPTRTAPSMFEPAHGSAPDIAGSGIANPAAAIRSGALMLAHCGLAEAAVRVNRALDDALRYDARPHDLGGSARTAEVTEAVLGRLR